MTTLRIRPQADRDTDAAADYLAVQANLDVAIQFLAAVEIAYRRIAEHPQAGSSVRALGDRLSRLRYRSIPGFEQYLVFYVPESASIDVVRVLHGARDLGLLFGGELE